MVRCAKPLIDRTTFELLPTSVRNAPFATALLHTPYSLMKNSFIRNNVLRAVTTILALVVVVAASASVAEGVPGVYQTQYA